MIITSLRCFTNIHFNQNNFSYTLIILCFSAIRQSGEKYFDSTIENLIDSTPNSKIRKFPTFNFTSTSPETIRQDSSLVKVARRTQESSISNDALCDLYNSTNMADLKSKGWIYGWDCVNGVAQSDPCYTWWSGLSCDWSTGKVYYLSLGYYGLKGSIPSSLSTLSSLRYIYLNSNALKGAFPNIFGEMPSLYYVDLRNNDFDSFNAPTSNVSSHSYLYYIDISNNAFSGDLPSSVCSLSSLRYLYTAGNDLNCYPSCVASMNLYSISIPSAKCPSFSKYDTLCALYQSTNIGSLKQNGSITGWDCENGTRSCTD